MENPDLKKVNVYRLKIEQGVLQGSLITLCTNSNNCRGPVVLLTLKTSGFLAVVVRTLVCTVVIRQERKKGAKVRLFLTVESHFLNEEVWVRCV